MKKILLLIIILTAILIRIPQLGTVPFGIQNDEVDYIYDGYTVIKTEGHGVAGGFLPLSFKLNSSLSPVPVYLDSISTGILGLSVFSGRLPFAILSIGSVILVFLLADELFGNLVVSFSSSLIFLLYPWENYLARGAWDGIIAQFFYLLGIYVFIKFLKIKKNINWSIIPFTLAFYSYHATKVFFLFLIPILLFYAFKKYISKIQIILFLILSLLIFISFALVTKYEGVTRQEVFVWNDSSSKEKIVDLNIFKRSSSNAPEKLKILFSNVPLFYTINGINNYLKSFSTELFFTNGDLGPVTGYGNFSYGMLNYTDAIFIISGLIFLMKKFSKKNSSLLLSLILIAPTPVLLVFSGTYIVRAIMLPAFLAILSGIGILGIITFLKQDFKKPWIFIFSILIVIHLYLFLSFLYGYYYQFNFAGTEYWNGSSRTLSEFIVKNYNNYDHFYVASGDDHLVLQYALTAKIDPHIIQKLWPLTSSKIKIGKVIFLNSCLGKNTDNPMALIPKKSVYFTYISNGDCYNNDSPTFRIADPMESLRTIYNVYEKN